MTFNPQMKGANINQPFSLWIVAIIACICAGCVSTDAPNSNTDFATDFKVGGVYRVKQPMFLLQLGSGVSDQTGIDWPGGSKGLPNSVEEYQAGERQRWQPQILGTVPAGTSLKLERISQYRNPDAGGVKYFVYAVFLSGSHSGSRVTVHFGCGGYADGWQPPESPGPMVNTDYLELLH